MSRSRRRITTAAVLSVGLALPLLTGPPAFADPGGEMTAQEAIDAKVDSAVVSAVEADGTSSFWVHLDSRADLSETHDAAEVHDELIAHAQASQQGILDLLGQSETPYRSYWIVNAIHVDGDMSTLADLAVLADVSTIEPVSAFALDTPLDGVPQDTVDGVEWGVADIKAPEVWDEFGNAGEDIVVATIDTGAQVDHPALIDSYRGNNGDGTFDHDYNFYDPYGLCGAAATCDNGGHGSHVVGTVVGADGDDDRIGVAPESTWITSVGCAPAPIDCPDTALLDSAQWILAPTDQNGDNPDPSKAPDIVNNSWGSNEDDPFFEEIGSAWRAAGIFSSWSIGNNGSAGCASAGAPGVYPDSFSTGAYDVGGNIGHFSARGPGRDGDVKPDLAAPGVNIRSAWPGSGYRAISGTSMAAPHTAGTVALMWAVSPALRGDVATTHDLLSATAQDVENLECGGTPQNNNVFGDGRLDAFAAVSATPRGETGIVTGTVTAGGKPLAAATVTASGTASRQVTTDDQGQYVLPPLPVGDYEISATRFGYDGTAVSVTVEDGGLEVDLELTELDSATVTGTVTDGSGQGWPLDARVSVDGTDVSAQTDPVTGEFALDLPVGEHAVTVTVAYAGYETVHHVAAVGEHIDIEVPIAADCSAPGYRMTETATVLTEPFDAAGVPEGWEIDSRTELGWQFDDPADRGNLTGSVGGFAIADRDHYGVGTDMDTDLISPSFSLEGDTSAELSFASDFRAIGSSAGFVLVSDDDGQTWQELWRTPTIDDRGPSEKRIGLADFADASSLRLAFRFDNAGTGRHWQVDAVRVGSAECVADPGGLITGRVYDLNTGQPMSGVVVADDAAGTAVRTGEDGRYLLYVAGHGDRDVRFAKHGWDPVDTATSVAPGSVTIMDASLASGVLDVDAADIATYVTMDGSWTEEVSLANSGSAPVTVEFSPGESGYLPQVGDSAEVDRRDVLLGEAAAEGKDGPSDSAASSVTGDWSEMPDYPVALRDAAATNGDGVVYVVGGANYSGELVDVYALDESDGSWQRLADLPAPRQYAQAEFHEGKLYVTGGWYGAWGRTYGQMYIYDPATDFWETAAVNPSPRAAAGSAVVDGSMYYIGGCIESDCTRDTNVSVYDPASDEWSQAADYPLPVAYPSCGGIHGKVICAGGTTGTPTQRAFAYDPTTDTWSEVTSMPEDLWGSAHAVVDGELVISGGYADGGSALTNVGYAYDPVSDTWSGVSNAPTVKARAAGACGFVAVGGRLDGWEISPLVESLPGLDRCGDGASVPWLSVDKETVTIAPGEKVTAEITVSAGPDDGAYEPGLYDAVVRIHHDSAGATPLVGVSMRVVPRADMGRLAGVVYRESCDGTLAPFGDAQVQVRGDDGIRRDMVTDESGGYNSWFVEGMHVVVASRDGYSSDFVILEIDRGRGATADLVLIELAC